MPSTCRTRANFEGTVTVGALFRDHAEEYISAYQPCLRTIKLIRSIRVCRTPALGGQQFTCKGCGEVRYQYFSCGNSHCPICGGIKRMRWQDRLRNRMLSVPYSHITFTLPHDLNGLTRRNQWAVYNLLFRSAWKTIKSLSDKPKNVGGLPGMSAVLHTWGSDLKYHVHMHCLVTFGGYNDKEGTWHWPRRKNKIAPYRKLSGKFKSIFLEGLKKSMDKGDIAYHLSYEELESSLPKKRWVVNHQWPTTEPKVIEEYLGRYICRIGISHKRLSYDKDGNNVRMEYNNYRKQESGKAAPKAYRNLPPLVAIAQIVQHLLPASFQRSRHYGLHAAPTYKRLQPVLPDSIKRNGATVRTILQLLKALLKQEPYRCEVCQGTDFEITILLPDKTYTRQYLPFTGRNPPLITKRAPKGIAFA